MYKLLAKISSARLAIKDHGILSFWIYVDYEDGMSQGIGGIALDRYDTAIKKRVGTAYGCEVIRQILVSMDVDDLSDLKNRHVWVHGEGAGLSFKPLGISPLIVDNPNSKPIIFSDIIFPSGV